MDEPPIRAASLSLRPPTRPTAPVVLNLNDGIQAQLECIGDTTQAPAGLPQLADRLNPHVGNLTVLLLENLKELSDPYGPLKWRLQRLDFGADGVRCSREGIERRRLATTRRRHGTFVVCASR